MQQKDQVWVTQASEPCSRPAALLLTRTEEHQSNINTGLPEEEEVQQQSLSAVRGLTGPAQLTLVPQQQNKQNIVHLLLPCQNKSLIWIDMGSIWPPVYVTITTVGVVRQTNEIKTAISDILAAFRRSSWCRVTDRSGKSSSEAISCLDWTFNNIKIINDIEINSIFAFECCLFPSNVFPQTH